MRINSQDMTLVRNYLQKYQFLFAEYELIKAKKHPKFRFLEEFYRAQDTDRRHFLKYYRRFKDAGGDLTAVLPGKRGPKWKTRRTPGFIEQKVLALRKKGINRYEIFDILQPTLKKHTPTSTIYAICKRHGMGRLKPPMKQSKQRIIKNKAGQLGHIDTHYLAKGIVTGDTRRYYLLGLIDAATRLVWVEILPDIKALTVMFASLKAMNIFTGEYRIKFEELLSDNGPEFGPKTSANKQNHPFERLLMEMGIKHRYIKPYRAQTNGKIERFWKTIEEDVLAGTYFESMDHLQQELTEYIYYYITIILIKESGGYPC